MHSPAIKSSSKEFYFTQSDFQLVRKIIYERAGLALADNKQEMVYSRLTRRLRENGFGEFSAYLDWLMHDNENPEWEFFTNALTTNLTSFFREGHHFDILRDFIKTVKRPVRIWCSASSTGEEPYSIAMTVCEAFETLLPKAEIVATDIDTHVLATAQKGIYELDKAEKMPKSYLHKYFLKGTGSNQGLVVVKKKLRDLIEFRQLNLLDEKWPLQGQFDIIFCRNVMIYFDKPTQAKILKKFAPYMKPGGLLMAGHSENFTQISDEFKLKGNTVYVLKGAS